VKKLLALLACVALLGLGAAAPVAAQGYDRVAQEETTDDDDGTDYGWIGLLGLAGLAGLLGRRREERDRVAARSDRTDVR
jgi:MYXO-CTERM domain-containing protein